MGNVVTWIIAISFIIIFALYFLGKVAGSVQGHDRCRYCKKKLRFKNGSYASTCSACGNTQPWAKAA